MFNKYYLITFFRIIHQDFYCFMRRYKEFFVDQVFAVTTNLLVFAYLMPKLGLPTNYGAVFVFSMIGVFGLFYNVGRIAFFLMDLNGPKSINYLLVLPIPSALTFFAVACGWMVQSICINLPILLIAKLWIWESLDLWAVDYVRFTAIFLITNLFYGLFNLWVISYFSRPDVVGQIWLRIVNPLFMFGGYFFPWSTLYNAYPIAGYITLLNPIIYVTEGLKGSSGVPGDYLPFWYCVLALIGFCAVIGSHGIYRMKKLLDCA